MFRGRTTRAPIRLNKVRYQKMLKMTISTSVWSAQYLNASWNIQQLVYKKFYLVNRTTSNTTVFFLCPFYCSFVKYFWCKMNFSPSLPVLFDFWTVNIKLVWLRLEASLKQLAAVKSFILLSLHFYNSECNDTWNQWNALQ